MTFVHFLPNYVADVNSDNEEVTIRQNKISAIERGDSEHDCLGVSEIHSVYDNNLQGINSAALITGDNGSSSVSDDNLDHGALVKTEVTPPEENILLLEANTEIHKTQTLTFSWKKALGLDNTFHQDRTKHFSSSELSDCYVRKAEFIPPLSERSFQTVIKKSTSSIVDQEESRRLDTSTNNFMTKAEQTDTADDMSLKTISSRSYAIRSQNNNAASHTWLYAKPDVSSVIPIGNKTPTLKRRSSHGEKGILIKLLKEPTKRHFMSSQPSLHVAPIFNEISCDAGIDVSHLSATSKGNTSENHLSSGVKLTQLQSKDVVPDLKTGSIRMTREQFSSVKRRNIIKHVGNCLKSEQHGDIKCCSSALVTKRKFPGTIGITRRYIISKRKEWLPHKEETMSNYRNKVFNGKVHGKVELLPIKNQNRNVSENKDVFSDQHSCILETLANENDAISLVKLESSSKSFENILAQMHDQSIYVSDYSSHGSEYFRHRSESVSGKTAVVRRQKSDITLGDQARETPPESNQYLSPGTLRYPTKITRNNIECATDIPGCPSTTCCSRVGCLTRTFKYSNSISSEAFECYANTINIPQMAAITSNHSDAVSIDLNRCSMEDERFVLDAKKDVRCQVGTQTSFDFPPGWFTKRNTSGDEMSSSPENEMHYSSIQEKHISLKHGRWNSSNPHALVNSVE